MKIVGVRHLEGYDVNTAYYFKTDIEDLNEGDIVVIDSNNKLKLAEVVEADSKLNKNLVVKKWVVDKVDTAKYNERIQKVKRLKELKNKIDKRRKELEEIQILEILAEKDDEMRQMLNEFKELSKDV